MLLSIFAKCKLPYQGFLRDLSNPLIIWQTLWMTVILITSLISSIPYPWMEHCFPFPQTQHTSPCQGQPLSKIRMVQLVDTVAQTCFSLGTALLNPPLLRSHKKLHRLLAGISRRITTYGNRKSIPYQRLSANIILSFSELHAGRIYTSSPRSMASNSISISN